MEWVYPGVIAAGRALFRALDLRIHLTGAELVPAEGPVVLAGNHVSFLDFLLLGHAARPSGRRVRFLARHDVWQHPIARPLMTSMRHVPVDRTAPAAAYLRARALLRDGEAVGVFPEAGISTSYTIRALMPGAVALARETGAPLVPVAMWGPQRIATAHRPWDLTRGRPITIEVGAPLDVHGAATVDAGIRRLGARLQSMVDRLQQSPRHQPEPAEHAPWHPAHLGGHAPTILQARLAESLPGSATPPTWAPRSHLLRHPA